MSKILKFIGKVKIPAKTGKFVANDKFVSNSREVKFDRISDGFMERFLAGDGKIEEPVDEQTLSYGNLTKGSVNGAIIEELGGEAKVEIILSAIYDLLLKQPNGEKEGVLLTNGYANIFYVRDTSGVLCAVSVWWRDVGWRVYTNSVRDPSGWGAEDRVFSQFLISVS